DAERRAIGRGIALERADEQRVCEIGFPREHRDAAGAGEIVGVGVLGNLDEHRLDVRMMTGARRIRGVNQHVAAASLGRRLHGLQYEIPGDHLTTGVRTAWRQQPNGQRNALGYVAWCERFEQPDARGDAHDAPLALRIRRRRERALSGERACGRSEERFRAYLGVREPLPAVGEDASLQTVDRLLRVKVTQAGWAW